MKIAVFSDVHDNIWNLEKALSKIQDCTCLLFCGDLCSPFIISKLTRHFKGQIHIVFGNNDGDTFRITQNAKNPNVTLHGEFFKQNIGGKEIAMNHYPDIAQYLAKSGAFDLVCYGHDHVATEYQEGKTLVLNPGALMGHNPKPPGENSQPRDVKPTFVIYDTTTESTTWYVLHEPRKAESEFTSIEGWINGVNLDQ